jgi:hypothetical protein
VHGAFLSALARESAGAEAVVALIDEGAWAERWGSDPGRTSDRRTAWRAMVEEVRVPMVFVDLSAPDLAACRASARRGDRRPGAMNGAARLP